MARPGAIISLPQLVKRLHTNGAPSGSVLPVPSRGCCVMLEPDEKPFADYLRDVDSMLVGVSAQQRNEIRRELLAHLEDVAAEQGSSANDAVFQEQVIADLGASQDLGLAFYEVHHGSHEVAKRVFDLCI